jgi:hypothetical protein
MNISVRSNCKAQQFPWEAGSCLVYEEMCFTWADPQGLLSFERILKQTHIFLILVTFTSLSLAHAVCSDACVFRREIITLRFVSILINLSCLLNEFVSILVCFICVLLCFVVCFCMLRSFCYWPPCFGLSKLLNKN